MAGLVYGVGVYEKGEYCAKHNKINTKEYDLWHSMLNRCYSKGSETSSPTYTNCSVSENFLNFQFFADWCQGQIGFNMEGYQLDKDILIKGNKIYSEQVCVFVPKEVNLLLTQRNIKRGNLPIGVSLAVGQRGYRSYVSISGVRKHLGYFTEIEEAFLSYKLVKEQHVKFISDKYRGAMDERVWHSLQNWEVSIEE